MAQVVPSKDRNPCASGRVEEAGENLIADGMTREVLSTFVIQLCTWGGYPGIAQRVLNKNTIETIGAAFRKAIKIIDDDFSRTGMALKAINGLSRLGTPQFTSKHLRILWPKFFPILDDLLSSRMGYSFDPAGYEILSSDCRRGVGSDVREYARQQGVENVEVALEKGMKQKGVEVYQKV